MAAGGLDRVAVGLAVVFHDPPWKPWGIRAKRVKGRGGDDKRSVEEKILDAIKNNTRGASGEVVQRAQSCLGRASGGLKAHERQALILVGALLGELERRGVKGRAVEALEKACDAIAGRDATIKEIVDRADRLASAVDRHILLDALRAAGLPGNTSDPGQLRLVNPFNPRLHRVVSDRVEAGKLAEFIIEYARLVGRLVERACSAASGLDCGLALLHVAFSLLEPAWYKVMGGEYVPPADTRIPTHTVFDHVNAALAVAGLLDGRGEIKGCLALVDLAGVQKWIEEARRTRDLWAASWLASLLAWKAVEPFVKAHGPGVLVQPPARLHPFYASWLLGELGYRDFAELRRDLGEEEAGWLAAALGLPKGWPVDPTVPSRVLLALPPEACSSFKETAGRAYREAWRRIVESAVNALYGACREIEDVLVDRLARSAGREGRQVDARREARAVCPVLDDGVRRLAVEVEPPLAVRLASASVEGVVGADPPPERFAWGFAEVLEEVYREEGRVAVKASGHAGPRFLQLARRLHELHGSKPRACTICGAPAIVDGRGLMDTFTADDLGRLRRASPDHWRVLAVEVGRERLCIYCLVKRLLRSLLTGGGALARELTGLGIEEEGEAEEALRWPSVDDFSARAVLAREAVVDAAEGVLRVLAGEKPANALLFIMETRRRLGLPPRSLPALGKKAYERLVGAVTGGLAEAGRREVAEWAVSLVMEYIHSRDAVARELEAVKEAGPGLSKVASAIAKVLEDAWRRAQQYRAVYAILVMDADFMGKRLLRGAVPEWAAASAREYYGSVVWLDAPPDKRELVVDFLARHAGGLQCCPAGDRPGCTCIPVTPSYYFTLSRALMALAAIDRRTVERLGGRVVYTGGDDLLALLPPVRRDGEGKAWPAALEATVRARDNYWAAGSNGFTVVESGDDGSGHVVSVVPAPVAYGRSGALFFVGTDTPMWVAVSLARGLEEVKDAGPGDAGAETVDLSQGSGGQVMWKDVLVVAGESSGAVVLPFTRGPGSGLAAPRYHGAVSRLLGAIEGGRGEAGVSASLLYDAVNYVQLLYRLVVKGRVDEAARVAYSLFERNTRGTPSLAATANPGRGVHRELADWIARPLGVEWEWVFKAGVVVNAARLDPEVRVMITATAHAVDSGGQLVFQLLPALLGLTRIVRSSK